MRSARPLGARSRFIAGLVSILVGMSMLIASPATALVFVSLSPSIPDAFVGQTVPGSFGINNNNTPPENFPVQFSNIDFYPSCGAVPVPTPDCSNGLIEDVYELSPTGVGQSIPPGNATCEGTWTITETAPGRWRLTPPGGEGTLVLNPGEFCVVNFTATPLRVPTVDVNPTLPGVQTFHASGADPLLLRPVANGGNLPLPRRGDALESTVFRAPTTIVTQAAQGPGVPGQTLATTTDTATLSPTNPTPPNVVPPTGTITFNLYGPFATPGAAACTGPPIATQTVPVNGFGAYTTPTPVPVTQAGTYLWTASYSGDANYEPAAVDPATCNVPNEQVTVAQAQPTLVTDAQDTAQLGQTVSDNATLAGGVNPTGTITFNLFGPNDPTCAGPPIFTSTVPVTGNGVYNSGPSQPLSQAGVYRWTAAYSGDANNAPAASPCNAPDEQSEVVQATPTIVTAATPTAPLGQPITDTATVTGTPGGPTPTGTVTFTVFGPNDPNCVGPPIFTSANRPLAGGPPPTATSDPFTPPAAGTYRWVAAYSGDANYAAVTSPCNAPGETSVVQQGTPTIVTAATPAAPLGQPITDTATVTGTPGGPFPTGTVTFTVFGPDDATCAGPPVFTSANRPLTPTGPATSTATSEPFTPTAPGTYRWIASYSGDANYAPVTSPCNAPGETSVITQVQPTIVTQASGPVTLTQPISDTATLSGGTNPTGTITFTLFGPNNPNCTGPPIFTSTVPVNGNGSYQSGPFTPTAPGSYQWVAVYSGDANNLPATSPCGAPNETSVVTALPTIMVEKTPNPTSRPEPGGDFTYTVVVTNTSTENLTITSLTDSVYGDLTTRPGSTCSTAIGTVLTPTPPGNTYTCTFTGPFTGPPGASLTDVVTVTGVNPAGVTVTDTDDATVTITPVPPTVQVEKTANPLSRPEPGGDFTYTVVVTNTSTVEPLTITSLTDSVYGDLTTRPGSTCNTAVGTVLATSPGPGNTYTCTFTAPFTGNAGASLTDVVTVTGVDDDGQTATDTDDATVTITDVLPVIAVQKTANPLTRPEPGGDFTFTVVVTNNSTESVTITSLNDNIYGNLTTRPNSTCNTAIGTVLAPAPGPGNTYTCQFTAPFTGNAGASQTDIVTATAVDDDGDTATASDDATVTILNVVPQILVEKDATPPSRPEPGGAFTFNVRVTNTGNEPLTITSLTDDVYGNLNGRGTCATGAVLQPGGTYTCSFQGDFFGQAGASQTDTVTVVGVDDEGTTVTDTDDATVTLTDVPPTIAVTKTPSPASRPEPGGDFTYTVVVTNTSNEPVTITALTDNVYGNLTTRPNSTCTNAIGTVLAPAPGPGNTYTCQFTAPFTGDAGASLTDVVTATAVDNEGTPATATDDATVTITGVRPTVDVQKTATPLSRPEPGGTFTFTVVVTNTSSEPVRITSLTDDVYGNLNGRGTCAIGATLPPGGTYTCSFTGTFVGDAGARQTDTVTVIVVDNDGDTATDTDDAVVTITNVPPTVRVDKTANPTSRPEPGGTFTFTVVVTNTSNEAVTITSLTDDVYGNLNGRGTCAIGVVLQPGGTYTCQFSGSFIGDAGESQVDTVTVTVVDNEGSPATDTDDAVVTLTNVPPTVAVDKTAEPTSMVVPGGTFTFKVVVRNTSNENVQVTSLVDDVYGNLNGRGTCAIGAVLQPGGTYTCTFPGDFRGNAGASQTDTVTATVTDNEGSTATAQDKATVTLTPAAVVVQQPLPRTGGDMGGPVRFATALVVVGLLMVATTWRSPVMMSFAAALTGVGHRSRTQPPKGASPLAFAPSPSPSSGTRLLASGFGLGVDRMETGTGGGHPGPAAAGLATFGVPVIDSAPPRRSWLRGLRRRR